MTTPEDNATSGPTRRTMLTSVGLAGVGVTALAGCGSAEDAAGTAASSAKDAATDASTVRREGPDGETRVGPGSGSAPGAAVGVSWGVVMRAPFGGGAPLHGELTKEGPVCRPDMSTTCDAAMTFMCTYRAG